MLCLKHIFCDCQVSKDLSLTNHVPAVKKCLETFVYRVKVCRLGSLEFLHKILKCDFSRNLLNCNFLDKMVACDHSNESY